MRHKEREVAQMAYVSQKLKSEIAPVVKAVLKKYGVKGTLSVHNHSALVLTIKSGEIDFIANRNAAGGRYRNHYIHVNSYHYGSQFTGKAVQFLKEVLAALNKGNWDKSDIQTDYFDRGWYVGVYIGKWNKPYLVKN
jgi:hypothetical protein